MIDDLVTRGRQRALPDVHVARRVPAAPARRQRRSAADAARASRSGASGRRDARAFERKLEALARRAKAPQTTRGDAAARRRGSGCRSTRTGCGASLFELLGYPGGRTRGGAPGGFRGWRQLAPAILAQVARDAAMRRTWRGRRRTWRCCAGTRRCALAGDARLRGASAGLSNELRGKLGAVRPRNAGAGGADRGHDAGGADTGPDAGAAAGSARRLVTDGSRRRGRSGRRSMFHVKQWTRLRGAPRRCSGKWNPRINLVVEASLADAWHRHFADSAQLWALRPPAARHWLDLGSGAGFPGLVIAALARRAGAELRVTLVESDRRKAAFLRSGRADGGLARRRCYGDADRGACRRRAPTSSRPARSPRSAILLAHAEKHRRPRGYLLVSQGRGGA